MKSDGRPSTDARSLIGFALALVGLIVATSANTMLEVVVAYVLGALSFGMWVVLVGLTIRSEVAFRRARRGGGRR